MNKKETPTPSASKLRQKVNAALSIALLGNHAMERPKHVVMSIHFAAGSTRPIAMQALLDHVGGRVPPRFADLRAMSSGRKRTCVARQPKTAGSRWCVSRGASCWLSSPAACRLAARLSTAVGRSRTGGTSDGSFCFEAMEAVQHTLPAGACVLRPSYNGGCG
jgi:hypothetical protein